MTSAEIQPPRFKNEGKPIPEWPTAPHDPDPVSPPQPVFHAEAGRFARIARVMITLGTVALAAWFGWAMWKAYMEAPWTRDSTVRAYVVNMAPEVSGRIVQLPVVDNQFVHKGDLLLVIDKTDFKIALEQAESAGRASPGKCRKCAAAGGTPSQIDNPRGRNGAEAEF